MNYKVILRSLGAIVAARLRQFPAVALIGPRQVGKTTLARWLAGAGDSVYLDLADPSDLSKLDDAAGYLRTFRRRLVVIDEVQRAPDCSNCCACSSTNGSGPANRPDSSCCSDGPRRTCCGSPARA